MRRFGSSTGYRRSLLLSAPKGAFYKIVEGVLTPFLPLFFPSSFFDSFRLEK